MEELKPEEVNKILIEDRRKLLKAIRGGPKTTGNLKSIIDTHSWHLTRYHLRKLVEAGYIKAEKKDKTTIFSITTKGYKGLEYWGE